MSDPVATIQLVHALERQRALLDRALEGLDASWVGGAALAVPEQWHGPASEAYGAGVAELTRRVLGTRALIEYARYSTRRALRALADHV